MSQEAGSEREYIGNGAAPAGILWNKQKIGICLVM